MRRRLAFDRFESRVVPASSVMGPYSVRELAESHRLAADVWVAAGDQAGPLGLVLDLPALTGRLAAAPLESDSRPIELALPRPDGSFARFHVWEVERSAEFVAALPTTRMYRGQGIDRPADLLAADITTNGFHARIIGPGAIWSIDPDQDRYVSSVPRPVAGHEFGCGCSECGAAFSQINRGQSILSAGGDAGGGSGTGLITEGNPSEASGTQLRQFRFVVASTGEYTTFSGGVAATQANIVTLTNRANLVFERDYSARLSLIPNAGIVYTNSTTDPYTGDNAFAMVEENITNLNAAVGAANFDIGHVFSAQSFGGGVGYYRGIGQPWKAGGATICGSFTTPTGFPFESNFIHELGHQFGALHTFNGVNGAAAFSRNGPTAVEVGSGSSIMAYPGISGADDLQAGPDMFFHSISYDDTQDFLNSLSGVGTVTPTGNTPPTVSGGLDATIPANTPFTLTATASDANGDSLTYSWEQRDVGAAQALGSPDNGYSPLFRAFAPTSGPARTFPQLSNLLAGTPSLGESLPTTDRTLGFRVMVRDNRTGGGGVSLDDVTVNVVNTGTAFAVTSPNTAVAWPAGSSQMITWNVAGTTGSAINTQYVNIRLSTDGGLTFPTLLIGNTPNDGSEPVTLPVTVTKSARIRVEPVGNIYFDISDVNFELTNPSVMRVTGTTPAPYATIGSTLDVTFNSPIDLATLGVDDLVLSQGSVTSVSLQSSTVARYTLSGIAGDGLLTVTMPAGAVANPAATAVTSFIGRYVVDGATQAFPGPLTPLGPLGSLTYTGTTTGIIGTPADTDSWTLNLDAGQSISIVAEPESKLQPQVVISRPAMADVIGTAGKPGLSAVVQTAAMTSAGVATITVRSVDSFTTGNYTLRIDLNAAVDAEFNNTIATAPSLAGSLVDLGGGAARWAARGRFDRPGDSPGSESESNNNLASAIDASMSFTPYTGNLYQLGFGTTIDYDFFNLGAFQPGDLITQVQHGAGSGRGTQADPVVYFYYNPASYYLGYDDNSGSGTDALFHRFNVDFSDTYYSNASGFWFFGDTVQMGYLLENVGPPPLTGGTFVDTEPNQTVATATDVSDDWRAVNHRSVIKGTLTSIADQDFYRYSFSAGDLVTFQVKSTSQVDTAINLRDAAGVVIARDLGDGGGLASEFDSAIYSFVIPSSGQYFVEVATAGSTSGSYTLTALLSATMPPPSPPDVYAIALTAGQPVTATVDRTLGSGTVDLQIVDASGAVLATGLAGAGNYDESVVYTPQTSGTYYLRVSGTPGDEYVVTATTGATLDLEPNDSFATAQTLTAGRALGGITAGDADWFRFNAATGELITLSLTRPASGPGEFVNTLDPVVEIYSPGNSLIATGQAVTLAQAFSTGEYRARIRGNGPSTGEYVISAKTSVDVPAKVNSLIIGDGSPQRSRVNSIAVVFSEPVTAPASAFTLTRQSTGQDVAMTATSTGNTVTLTFSGSQTQAGSLADGRYSLTIHAAEVTDAAGQPLDGNGDGTFGDDYLLVGSPANGLFRLFGDADGSGQVGPGDFLAFRLAFLSASPVFDVDNDALVGPADFLGFRLNFLATI